MPFDAAVIGAGPAGSTAARLLAAAGWRVALVEKSEFPRRKVCGEFISAPTFSVLDACGIGDAFRSQGGPAVRRIALYADQTVVEAAAPRTEWGRALGREHLDLLLRDAATQAGALVFQPAELIALEQDGQIHRCHLKWGDHETRIEARTVIAATGSWRIKPPFAVPGADAPTDLLAFKAHFPASRLPEGVMPLLAFPGGYGGLVHTDGGRTSLSCCIRRDALAAIRRPGDKAGDAVLRHILAKTRGAREALKGFAPEGAVLSAGPIRPGIRPRYAGDVFFTGNLAGEAHPVIAEGISMAIQSSWLLSQRLIAAGPAGDHTRAGTAYARDWRMRFAPRIAAAALFAHTAMKARGAATGLVRSIPALLTLGAALSGKTHRTLTAGRAN